MPDPDIAVRVGLDHDPDDPALTYTDITDRVHYGDGGQAVTVTIGRSNETDEIKPTDMGYALKNGDGRFTPNNSSSPYAGKWEQGRRCQIAETVDGEEFLLGTCFLEAPTMAVIDSRSSQPVVVSAIDRLGRLESAPAFEGTLAEHIRANSAGLVEWFSLSDNVQGGQYMSTLTGTVTQRLVSGFSTAFITAEVADLVRPTDIAGPPGDDQSYARWAPVGDAVGGLGAMADATLVAPVNLVAGATDTVAISAWVQLGTYDMAPGSAEPQGTLINLRTPGGNFLWAQKVAAGGVFYAGGRFWSGGAGVDSTLDVGRPFEDVWRLITSKMNLQTGVQEVWVGSDAVASKTIAAPGAQTYTQLEIGNGWSGGIAHVQIRIGSGVMTRAEHLAQHAHGYLGLQRQTVAERIVTLAGYAGIPASEVDISSAASTPMQAARLAGVIPASSLRAAAATGQDTLGTNSAGKITVVARARRYNQPVTMTIPSGWVRWRGLSYRTDKPVSDVTVTRSGGGSVRLTDRVRGARYGVTGWRADLDTAIDADAGNLARWALAAYGQMRTRIPLLRINMLRRTAAERKALLRLVGGDRIELTDLPADSPDDVPHLIVQGIKHIIGPGRIRVIEFNLSPLLGPSPGVPPACPMVGDLVSTSAIIAY